jgi:hypothetical protein
MLDRVPLLNVPREQVQGVALLTPWEGLGPSIMDGLFIEVSRFWEYPIE